MRTLSIIISLIFVFSCNLFPIAFSLNKFKLNRASQIKIVGDSLFFNTKTNTFIAEGYVKVNYSGLNLVCDRLEYDKVRKRITAIGNVKIITENSEINADRAELDLKKRTGTIYKGKILFKDRQIFLKAEKIIKKPDGYYIQKCTLTSCTQIVPVWSFTAKEAEINTKGKVSAKKIRFKVKDYTLFYLPSAALPGVKASTTGFLIPSVSISNSKGFRYSQGFYTLITPSLDSTLYYDIMSKRGTKGGAEFRYRLTDTSFGWFKEFYLYDSYIKDDDYSIRDDKRKRYYIAFHHYQLTEDEWKIYVDANYVSDINYIYDFPEDFSKDLIKDYLSDNLIPVSVYVSKNFFDTINITSETQWRKTLLTRSNSNTTQKLVDATLFTTPTQILGSTLYKDIKLNYGYFYRKNGDKISRIYGRADFTKHILDSELVVSPVLSHYFYEENGNTNSKFRGFLKLKWRNSLEISKRFNLFLFNLAAVKHSIQPEIEYNFISYPSEVPRFDFLENERKKNVITYHVKQKLIAKTDTEEYFKLFDWDLYQSYQIQKYSYLFRGKSFSNIISDMKIGFWKFFLENSFEINPYERYMEVFNLKVSLDTEDKFKISYDYRFEKNEIKQMTLDFESKIFDLFSLNYYINYDYLYNRLNSASYGFNFHPQCWAFNFEIKDERNPKKLSFNFSINLTGIGSSGSSY